jgi:HAD superfamily phosphatase (TIGR01681 family)
MNGGRVPLPGSDPAAYLSAAREIESNPDRGLLPVSIGIVSSFTLDLVAPYLVVEAAQRGFRVTPFFAPFNQLEQQILQAGSALYRSQPDVILVAARLEEMSPALSGRFLTLAEDRIRGEIQTVIERFENLVARARQISSASILICNLAEPLYRAAGIADPHLPFPQSRAITRINDGLGELARRTPGVFIFDYARLLTDVGLSAQDAKLWYLARIPLGPAAQREMGKRLARYLRALKRPACKCLVLDLDQTLWGGIIGEDGVGGIQIGEEFPGLVFKDFQRYLLTLRDRGILLAIASKNNLADVKEVFDRNPEMVLKWDDFSAHRINWDDKATSLKAIAKELRLGTDALALFDDAPLEREWVRSQLPEVQVIEVPAHAREYRGALEESGAFDQLLLSEEDRRRNAS